MTQDQIQLILKSVDEIVKNRIDNSNEKMMTYTESKYKDLLDIFNQQYADNQDDFKSVHGNINTLKGDINSMTGEISSIKSDISFLKNDVNFIKDLLQNNVLVRLDVLEGAKTF